MELSSEISSNMVGTNEEIEETLGKYGVANDDEISKQPNIEESQTQISSDMNTTKRKRGKECERNPMNKGKGKQSQLVLDSWGDALQMKSWSFDAVNAREYVVKMVIRDEMSFQSIEKQGMRDYIFALCPQFKMPSRSTIQRDCWKLYTTEREKLKEIFKHSCQGVCLTTDTWTSSNMENYMCVTAHYIDNDWILQKKVINFCKIGSHRGNDIGRAIEDCLSFWELDKKLLTVTVDNASANDVACSYLSSVAKDRECITEGKYLHMRCITHIVNLIVHDGIKQCGEHVDKLRAVIKYIRGSPSRMNAFKMLAEKWKVESNKSLTLDVCTRWNSTYDMLTSALPYKTIFARMDIPQGIDLDILTDDDWKKISVLALYLKEFYAMANRISGSLYVTSNFMIFHIAHIVKVLDSLAANEEPTLRLMASEIQKKCDKYWGSFDKINMLMLVPTILDPYYKLRGVVGVLKRIFPNENVDYMTTQVRITAYELFDRYKTRYTVHESQDAATTSNPPSQCESSSWLQEYNVIDSVTSGNIDGFDNYSDRVEFELYLRERNEVKELTSQDLLRWWRLNGPRYPIISRIARDIFAIPISAVPSEFTFSTGGRHLTSYRSRLKPGMIQALVCTQDWLRSCTTNKEVEDSDSDDKDGPPEVDEDRGTFYA